MRGPGVKSATLALLVGVAGCLVLPANSATASEVTYCVTCTGPDNSYLCKVVGEGSRPNDALKLYCIIRTAKEGNHATCKAKRDLEGCVGEVKVYSYDGPTLPADIASDPRAKKIMGKLAREQKKFEKPKGEEPQTLVELTGRAMSSSRRGLRNAREAITGPKDEASNETTASTTPPSPQVSAPAPQASAPPSVTPVPPPQKSVALPEPSPATAAPASEPSSPSRMKRASSAVGSFARKSYHCMWSLFRNCSGETEKSSE